MNLDVQRRRKEADRLVLSFVSIGSERKARKRKERKREEKRRVKDWQDA